MRSFQFLTLSIAFTLSTLAGYAAHADDFRTRPGFIKEISMWPPEARVEAHRLCTTPSAKAISGTPAAETHEFLREISRDSVGSRLVQRVIEADPVICQYAGFGQRGYFDNEANMIGFEGTLSSEQKLLILIHEARHLDQHSKGFERTLDYSLDEYVRFTFMLEADAQAVATLVAWNLKEQGFPMAWRGLMSLEHYRQTGRAFEGIYYGTIARGGALKTKALATAFAFRAWTENPWLTSVYRLGAKAMYWDELEESKRLPRYENAPLAFYSPLCTDEAFTYPCLRMTPAAKGLSRDR